MPLGGPAGNSAAGLSALPRRNDRSWGVHLAAQGSKAVVNKRVAAIGPKADLTRDRVTFRIPDVRIQRNLVGAYGSRRTQVRFPTSGVGRPTFLQNAAKRGSSL